jgi:hypothetical protein
MQWQLRQSLTLVCSRTRKQRASSYAEARDLLIKIDCADKIVSRMFLIAIYIHAVYNCLTLCFTCQD